MRGADKRSGELFSYVDLKRRVRADLPLRAIRSVVSEALDALSGEFAALYSGMGRPSIAPEILLRAMLLQAFYSVRSERQLMERLEYDLLFRRFVGLGVDEPVWDHSTFSKNATGCSTAMSLPGSCRRSWRSLAFGDSCRATISASTGRSSRPGPE
jgi:transposase